MTPSDPDARLRRQLAPGNIFEEKYEILSGLGIGSFAVVVKARHAVMGREVALKCLKPSVVRSNPEVSERFVHEVQIVSRLRHPNTVTIFDFGQTDDDLAYMVLEYVAGRPLDELIEEQGALSAKRAAHICRQILKSLAEAHAQGIIHRDLKPSNIMLTELHGERDFVKVLDFGVAKLIEEADQEDDRFEPRSTRFIGTPVYMSPEQVLGKSVGPASDLYSLGLLLCQMLTGRPPIENDNVAAVVREHLRDAALDLAGFDKLDEPMRRIISKATARQPDARFGSVEEFADALPGRGALDSIERVKLELSAPESEDDGLDEKSEEPDVFSGDNYIAPPDPEEEEALLDGGGTDLLGAPPATSAPGPAETERGAQSPSATTTRRPTPSPSSEELDLDLDTVERHKRRVERRRRAKTAGRSASQRSVDGSWEAREYWRRLSTYTAGLVCAYAAFVLLSALLHEQHGGTRLVAGLLMGLSAVIWSAFSSTRSVSGDFGQRWLMPTARHFVYLFLLLVCGAGLGQPSQAAAGLSKRPTWFFEALPEIPPLTWLETATLWGASKLAALFDLIAGVLPYG